jgi:hypothetical protein
MLARCIGRIGSSQIISDGLSRVGRVTHDQVGACDGRFDLLM